MPRLLLILPQLPQDPASGAARSMRTICELLAAADWEIRALATTATESAAPLAAGEFLRGAGYEPTMRMPNRSVYRHDRAVIEFTDRHRIVFRLLDTGDRPAYGWLDRHGPQFNRLFRRELADFRPDILFGYGGADADVARYHQARASGCKVVFGLRNHGYYQAPWLRTLDAVLTPSRFLSVAYKTALGLESTPLPPPLNPADVVAVDREAIFFTAINPTREKGSFFLARLAEELALRRPDLPMLFIESRGATSEVVRAGLDAGFDLRRHESLMFAPAVARPAEFFRGTRVILAPSVWPEPFGRVVAEALVNGIPPIISGRGGLPEAANGAGFVLPLPDSLTLETQSPVAAADVEPWLQCMERLADNDYYSRESARALAASKAYLPAVLTPRYLEFFESVLKGART